MTKRGEVSLEKIVSYNLDRLMKKRKTNSFFLAHRSGVSQNYIDKTLSGDATHAVSISEIVAFAKVFGVNWKEFFKPIPVKKK